MTLNFVCRTVSSVLGTINRNFYFKSYMVDDSGINKRVLKIKPWQVENFFKIIDEDLNQFLRYDKCCRIADNYLIAMVFIYFIRADFEVEEYNSLHFMAALRLALDMEEDDDNLRICLQRWLNKNDGTPNILHARNRLFQRIEFHGSISRKCCEIVMRKVNPNHKVWRRLRHINHSGAISEYLRRKITCPKCG